MPAGTILICDDEPSIRQLFRYAFEHAGADGFGDQREPGAGVPGFLHQVLRHLRLQGKIHGCTESAQTAREQPEQGCQHESDQPECENRFDQGECPGRIQRGRPPESAVHWERRGNYQIHTI